MTTTRQMRRIFSTFEIRALFLSTLAILAAIGAPAQEPRLPDSRSDLFPADPLNPQLPMKDPAASPPAQESGGDRAASSGTKVGNGRTEITADEAAFDPDTHIATFRQNVVLKDPDINVVCDKLTAYLKHDQQPSSAIKRAKSASLAASPKGGGAGEPSDDPHRTLDKAVAEMNAGGRLEITRQSVESDGAISYSIGHGSRAVYNAITGATVLTGMPDATKGMDRVVATDEKTVITMLRNGEMSTVGPHKVIIISKSAPPAAPTAR